MDSKPSQLKTCFLMLVPSHSTRRALFWRLRPTLADRLENDTKLTTNMSQKQWRDWVSPDIDYIEACPGLPIPPDAAH